MTSPLVVTRDLSTFPKRAEACAVDTGLLASLVLSTLPSPTSALVSARQAAAAAPVATGTFPDAAVPVTATPLTLDTTGAVDVPPRSPPIWTAVSALVKDVCTPLESLGKVTFASTILTVVTDPSGTETGEM